MKARRSFRGLVMGLTMAGCMAGAARAGNLEPPGTPASTMKTLDEVEPCRLISRHGFTIDAPGSYCLTGDLSAEDDERDGITINASNVTLDLRGFTIGGRNAGAEKGISASQSLLAVVIRNGTISGGWGGGGILMSMVKDSRFENLRVLGNSGSGIVVGNGNQITGCLIQANQGSGIVGGDDSQITDCLIQGNQRSGIEVGARATILRSTIAGNGTDSGNDHGIRVNSALGRATISDCTITDNRGTGIKDARDSLIRGCNITGNGSYGIHSPDGRNTIVDCTISFNGLNGILGNNNGTISRCTINNNRYGIFVDGGAKISDCTVSLNSQGGIFVSSSGYVLNNIAEGNGGASGITVLGTNNRVEGNSVSGQGCGIESLGSSNLFIRNSARGNGGTCSGGQDSNYGFGAGDLFGTIVSTNAALNAASNALVNISLP